MKLWGGRFVKKMPENAWNLNSSIAFDRRLMAQDVRGSTAWAGALLKAGVLSEDEHAAIVKGLDTIRIEFENGSFIFLQTDEDIHTAVERRLGELIGATAGKLHTGRSRNDQVATDFRMWILDALPFLDEALKDLQVTLLEVAERHRIELMPGYTHLQRAQPVLFAHWLMSYFWMIQRDRERLCNFRDRLAILPLGSGALAGCSFDIDREALSKVLGFDSPSQNSMDAVSDRDFALEYLFCTAMIGVHLSKLSEAVVLFTTAEFGFFELSDAYSTGSSLMPQKKNSDLFELARGKTGTLIGLLTGLLATLKGLPSAYDKDLQEDKVPVFQATDILMAVLPVLSEALDSMVIHEDKMLAAIDESTMTTDIADYLTRQGFAFREAHAAVGNAILMSAVKGIKLKQFVSDEWKNVFEMKDGLDELFNPFESIKRRKATGGTSPESVEKQIQDAWILIQRKAPESRRKDQ